MNKMQGGKGKPVMEENKALNNVMLEVLERTERADQADASGVLGGLLSIGGKRRPT